MKPGDAMSITCTRAVALPLLALALFPALANAIEYTGVDTARSKIGFSYTEMGVKLNGSFAKYTAQLKFDPTKPQEAHVLVDVAMASIDAGSAEATSEVADKDWFDAVHSPAAHFESTSVTSQTAEHYQLAGNLTIKGHTHAVAIPVTLATNGGRAALDGTFTFNRTDYGVGEGEWADTSIVANPIQVQIHIVLSGGG
jgi:polyisoprenoid-binding protein YceI